MKGRTKLNSSICYLLIICMLLPISGCWSYQGLDQMAIVAGMALDLCSNDDYLITVEIIDMSKPVKQTGLTTILLSSEGKTIFEALRSISRKTRNKLYFGHMMNVIVGEKLAKNQNMAANIDFFIRNSECRETMFFLVSQEKNAGDNLRAEKTDGPVISYVIESVLEKDSGTNSSTHAHKLYEVYRIVTQEGKALSLPAIHVVDKNDKRVNEINGTAVFKDGYLVGYLSPEESKYLLFVLNEVKGGVLTVSDEGLGQISLEIKKNKTKSSHIYLDGQVEITIKTETEASLKESEVPLDSLDNEKIEQIERAAEDKLRREIEMIIKKVQSEFDSDIFGFGEMIIKKDQKLWNILKDSWDGTFRNITVNVDSKVKIKNTSQVKNNESE